MMTENQTLDLEAVDDTVLNDSDLQLVKEAVIKVAVKFHSLGLALGINVATLNTIRKEKGNNDCDEALTEVLQKWLEQAYDVSKHGLPSWRTLVKAVNNRVGGNHHALAKSIASSHQADNGEPPSKRFRSYELTDGKGNTKVMANYAGSVFTFTEAVPQYLCCNICHSLPADPHRVGQSIFCKLCLQNRGFTNGDDEKYRDPASKTQIEQLEVKCPNLTLGCEWQGQLGQIMSHRGSDCLKETVPCPYQDIGCQKMMLRDEGKRHENEDRQQHLDHAMKTITTMKQTDSDIRQKMNKLEDSFHEKLEQQKQEHEKAIQQLKEEISQCPPVIVMMTNCNPYYKSEKLSVFNLFHNDKVFISSTFYSHPQGYKLCIALKCMGTTENSENAIMKLKVAPLYEPHHSLSWPCKGVADITVQAGNQNPVQLKIGIDIAEAPSDSSIDHIICGDCYRDYPIPTEWNDLRKINPSPNITLKVEKIKVNTI